MGIDGATYTTGTATVAAGTTAVTGQGTDWLTAGLKPGDQFSAGGLAVTIATVVSNSSLTLVAGWPGGALNAAAYEIRFVDAASRALAKTIGLLAKLGNGNIGSLADLQTAANKLAYYSGTGVAALTDLTPAARSVLAQTTQALMRTTGLGLTSVGNLVATAANAVAARDAIGLGATSNPSFGRNFNLVSDNGGNVNLFLDRGSGLRAGIAYWNSVSNDFNLRAYGTDGSTVRTQITLFGNSDQATVSGALTVYGALSKSSGTFLIDHPLDPYNRDLVHGFVEAPRYDLIYRGTVQLASGRATVDIDAASGMDAGTFAALTINACVTSLQNQDGFARVKPGPIDGGSFEIICEDEACSDTIAWVVIAERNDPFVKHLDDNCDADGRLIVQRAKPDPEA